MPGVIATGHRAWHPSDAEPFVTVPPGMCVLFFQEPPHLLSDTVGRRLEQLDDTAFRDPAGVAEAGTRCRDYSLTHPSMLDFARVLDDDGTRAGAGACGLPPLILAGLRRQDRLR